MKVIHLISSKGSASGGIGVAVSALVDAQQQVGLSTTLLAMDELPVLGWRQLANEGLHQVSALRPEVLHVHGLWSPLSSIGRAWSRQGGKVIVSPHGMLDDWAWQHRYWKKQVAWWSFERGHLQQAARVHALCRAEEQSIRQRGITTPIITVPNGVGAMEATTVAPPWQERWTEDTKVLLFLGRLHAKKGLLSLVKAWGKALQQEPETSWRLVLAGWDDGGFGATLRQVIVQEQLDSHIFLPGSLQGASKAAALQQADAFILPSYSEGLPMAILEAWSAGCPVWMTAACNLPEGFEAGAAREISTDETALAASILDIWHSTNAERQHMREAGKQLVASQFSWPQIAATFAAHYQSIAR